MNEPLDRNKSDLTHKVTDAAYQWLEAHGFKPVETEVPMPWEDGHKGWIADLASVIVPTQTELIAMRMIPRPPRWEYKGKNEGYEAKRAAWEALYVPLDRLMTCLVEVKVTRSDFRGDHKWNRIAPADLSFLAVPAGVVRPEEWPEGWGILEFKDDAIRKVRNPIPRVATVEQRFSIVYSILVRRDHRTRYAENRQWQREERIEQAEHVASQRLGNLIDAVRDIAAGKFWWSKEPIRSIEEALNYHGLKKVRPGHLEKLAEIFGIAASKEKVVSEENPA